MQEAHGTHSLPRPQRSSPGGTVTAGNSSGINDGAAALLVASERAVQQYGLAPLARVTAGAAVDVESQVVGIGPEPATGKLLDRTGLGVADLGLIELNESVRLTPFPTRHQGGEGVRCR